MSELNREGEFVRRVGCAEIWEVRYADRYDVVVGGLIDKYFRRFDYGIDYYDFAYWYAEGLNDMMSALKNQGEVVE